MARPDPITFRRRQRIHPTRWAWTIPPGIWSRLICAKGKRSSPGSSALESGKARP